MCANTTVVFPEVRPGMISGFMLALTLSIDDFAVTVFTIGNQVRIHLFQTGQNT